MAKKSRVRRRKSIKRKSRVRRGRKIIKGGADGSFFAIIPKTTLDKYGFKEVEYHDDLTASEKSGKELWSIPEPNKLTPFGKHRFVITINKDKITYGTSIFGELPKIKQSIKDGEYEITRITRILNNKVPKDSCIVYYIDTESRIDPVDLLDKFEEPD